MATKPRLRPDQVEFRIGLGIFATFVLILATYCIVEQVHKILLPDRPASGVVLDQANVLSEQEEADLNALINQHNTETNKARVAIITYPNDRGKTLDYATDIGNHWEVSDKGEDNGIVIALEVGTQNAGIAVAHDANQQISDDEAVAVIDNVLLPAYSNHDYASALKTAVNELYGEAEGTSHIEVTPHQEDSKWSFGAFWNNFGFAILFISSIIYLIWGTGPTARFLGKPYRRKFYNDEIEEALREHPELRVDESLREAYSSYRKWVDISTPNPSSHQSYNKKAQRATEENGALYTLYTNNFAEWYAYYQHAPQLYSILFTRYQEPITFSSSQGSSYDGGTYYGGDSGGGGFDGGGGGSD